MGFNRGCNVRHHVRAGFSVECLMAVKILPIVTEGADDVLAGPRATDNLPDVRSERVVVVLEPCNVLLRAVFKLLSSPVFYSDEDDLREGLGLLLRPGGQNDKQNGAERKQD